VHIQLTYIFNDCHKLIYLGYSEGKKYARQEGIELLQSDEERANDEVSEELDDELIHAAKYFRFFTHTENEEFALFVEHGLNRDHEVQLMQDQQTLSLKVNIPVPPDELLNLAGFHASMASLGPVKEEYTIQSSRKLDAKSKIIFHYPSLDAPVWTVFKYKHEKEKETEKPDKIEVDLTSKLLK
jgi:hypothetical protein